MKDTDTFDIVIVGGGLAGGLAAAALGQAGFRCAVVDAADPATMRGADFDGRTSALSYACVRVFKRLGLWGDIEKEAEPIRDILVTDGRARSRFDDGAVSPFSIHFDSQELDDGAPLGWIVENRFMREAILDSIERDRNVSIFAPVKRASARYDDGAAAIGLEDGRILTGALVLAADGRYSSLRSEAAIKTNNWRYKQTGIVITVAHERSHEGVAQEFFLPSGPFAILPMTPVREGGQIIKHRSNLVWTERADAASAYMKLSDADFVKEIENRFGPYLGAVSLAGPRWSYPLAFTLAQSFIAPRLALIGDAAHAIHPIAGQGYNLGVKDIAALTDVLTEARRVGLDIGAMTVLQNYQRWRRFDSATIALSGDLINRLFSNDFTPLRIARDIGMGVAGKIAPLRKVLMRNAGADLGALPSLMQAGV